MEAHFPMTLKEKWFHLWGLGFVVNLRSKEIHRLKSKHRNCNTEKIRRVRYVSQKTAVRLLQKGYNGCRWCWKEQDFG